MTDGTLVRGGVDHKSAEKDPAHAEFWDKKAMDSAKVQAVKWLKEKGATAKEVKIYTVPASATWGDWWTLPQLADVTVSLDSAGNPIYTEFGQGSKE